MNILKLTKAFCTCQVTTISTDGGEITTNIQNKGHGGGMVEDLPTVHHRIIGGNEKSGWKCEQSRCYGGLGVLGMKEMQ